MQHKIAAAVNTITRGRASITSLLTEAEEPNTPRAPQRLENTMQI